MRDDLPQDQGIDRQDNQNGPSEVYGGLWLSANTTARLTAAKLMDGAKRKQQAQTSTRMEILPRPNTERIGGNRKKNKREIWHLLKCHPIKPAAQSGEQGNSRHR